MPLVGDRRQVAGFDGQFVEELAHRPTEQRVDEVGRDVAGRDQHEPTLVLSGVGDLERWHVRHEVAEDQQIEIERART